MDTMVDHFTPLALRVRGNKGLVEHWTPMLMDAQIYDQIQ